MGACEGTILFFLQLCWRYRRNSLDMILDLELTTRSQWIITAGKHNLPNTLLGLPCMSYVSSFSAHVLKTIALLIVLPVHLQGCFVRTSLPLAHGGRTVVERAERKCQGSFSKTIISVYIFVWVRETKSLSELRHQVLKT